MGKKKNYVSDWSDVINNMKRTVVHYYLKSDTDRKQPYKFAGMREEFETGDIMVHFYSIRTEDTKDYILPKEKFLELFLEVKEEY